VNVTTVEAVEIGSGSRASGRAGGDRHNGEHLQIRSLLRMQP